MSVEYGKHAKYLYPPLSCWNIKVCLKICLRKYFRFMLTVAIWKFVSTMLEKNIFCYAHESCPEKRWQVSENLEMDRTGHFERVYKAEMRSFSSLRTLRTLLKGKIHIIDHPANQAKGERLWLSICNGYTWLVIKVIDFKY